MENCFVADCFDGFDCFVADGFNGFVAGSVGRFFCRIAERLICRASNSADSANVDAFSNSSASAIRLKFEIEMLRPVRSKSPM
jgi:hypothetical protein